MIIVIYLIKKKCIRFFFFFFLRKLADLQSQENYNLMLQNQIYNYWVAESPIQAILYLIFIL
jgi:hypothetical protein